MLQATLSRNVGSRPRAKNRRSTSSSPTTIATSAAIVIGLSTTASGTTASRREERDGEHEVDGEQLQPLVPRRLALVGHVVGDDDRQQDPAQLEAVEDEGHRVRA